ncbi:hypothetical protein ACLOJK_014637 [Asimina triloba]
MDLYTIAIAAHPNVTSTWSCCRHATAADMLLTRRGHQRQLFDGEEGGTTVKEGSIATVEREGRNDVGGGGDAGHWHPLLAVSVALKSTHCYGMMDGVDCSVNVRRDEMTAGWVPSEILPVTSLLSSVLGSIPSNEDSGRSEEEAAMLPATEEMGESLRAAVGDDQLDIVVVRGGADYSLGCPSRMDLPEMKPTVAATIGTVETSSLLDGDR